MINKEALEEIREIVFNAIESHIGENIRNVVAYHGTETIKINFVGGGFHEPLYAMVTYGTVKIGNFIIMEKPILQEAKDQFKADFDKSWGGIGERLIEEAIKNIGLAQNLLTALTNKKTVFIEGMAGVNISIEFTEPDTEVSTGDVYHNITVTDNGMLVFVLFDKIDPLTLPTVATAVAAKVNKTIKARMLKS